MWHTANGFTFSCTPHTRTRYNSHTGGVQPPQQPGAPAGTYYPQPPQQGYSYTSQQQPVQTMQPMHVQQPQPGYQQQPQYPPPGGQHDPEAPGLGGGHIDDKTATAIAFAETTVRNGFVRKVFGIVMLQLAVTVGFSAMCMYVEPLNTYLRYNRCASACTVRADLGITPAAMRMDVSRLSVHAPPDS